jgi:mannosyl-3-phosphoglycerate phosphatase
MKTQAIDERLIFTDLDGTLVDHHTYSFADAANYIAQLNARHIAIVPNTSKTFCEVKKYSQEMGLNGPLITENGSGIYIPIDSLPQQPSGTELCNNYWVKSFSYPRQYWLDIINTMRPAYAGCFESFSDMSIQRLVEVTGLSEDDAALAKNRDYSEPLLWLSTESLKLRFIEEAKKHGARPLIGGRFLHMCGQSNKGLAMQWLADEIQKQYPHQSFQTIALGDGGNDIDMLEKADVACRIASPVNAFPQLTRKHNVYDSTAFGPNGWVEVLQKIIID